MDPSGTDRSGNFAELRDDLLPKPLFGEVRVTEADRVTMTGA